jgi:hypothetical protein
MKLRKQYRPSYEEGYNTRKGEERIMWIAHSAIVARLVPVLAALVLGFASPRSLWAQGTLENPAPDSSQSGLGLVSGWKCVAGTLTATFDGGPPTVVAYGTSRRDTLVANGGPCASEFTGFGLLINWNLLGNGTHTVTLFDNGVQFGSATFTVTTLGQEFLTGASGNFLLSNFPQPGKNVTVRWQESSQNFVISDSGISTELYQLHSNGLIWRYTGPPCSGASCPGWQLLDNNPATVAIVAANGSLYQLHSNGLIWQYTGPPCSGASCPGWLLLDNNAATVDIEAAK